jgi:hypothetical protein
MELAIGVVICLAVAGLIIYSLRDESHSGWDD